MCDFTIKKWKLNQNEIPVSPCKVPWNITAVEKYQGSTQINEKPGLSENKHQPI